MTSTLTNVTLVPGGGRAPRPAVDVTLAADGTVTAITPTEQATDGEPVRHLIPAAVDTHLDNLVERRTPRATVVLDLRTVITSLDAECAAAGIGTVCVAARCEDAPGKGVHVEDAVRLAEILEEIAPTLACDWRLHARVEVTDDAAVEALEQILRVSTRVALISVMEHSLERSRFSSAEAHRSFYAEDWGVSLEEVDRILAQKATGGSDRQDRRERVAQLAADANILLASHDDRDPADVEDAHRLGAGMAEFPLTLGAAERARELGLMTVLGAPNAVRGKSTSSGNVLVADAVRAGSVDILCSDYLPQALQTAPFVLATDGVTGLGEAVDLVSVNPARCLGLPAPTIAVGEPLTAALGVWDGHTFVGQGLWRDGRQTFSRVPERV